MAAEVRDWSRLSSVVAAEAVLPTVSAMHRAITDAGFRWVGPLGRPVRRVHDRVVDGVYGTVQRGIHLTGTLASQAADRVDDGRDVAPTGASLKARAIAHGVLDERLLAQVPAFEVEVTWRHAGRVVPPTRTALGDAYPGSTGTLTVFVHGLVDSEETWAPRTPSDADLPATAAAAGSTVLMLRYGTGRPVGRNGADLARLLEATVAAWPVPVTRLVLVGHSMGGLVARAACRSAQDRGHEWLEALRDVCYLGTPHLGSWLEKAANVGGWVVRRSSRHAAPIAGLIEQRSRGIKDLRHGSLEADALGPEDADDLLTGLRADVDWLPDVGHHLVVGRLRPQPGHPLNRILGDALVRAPSARGHGRRRRIVGPVTVTEVAASHTALIRRAEVAALLTEVLTSRR